MTIRAVVFDIGGVLEVCPSLGVDEKWEAEFGLAAGTLNLLLMEVWKGGSVGTITEAQVHQKIGEILAVDEARVSAFMADIWTEYLGELNVELADYFRTLHGPYLTAIVSNSFVGAREKEEARYHFGEMTDLIVYSHEAGIAKPDPRIYQMTCERLGAQPHEVIFLDDMPTCVSGAMEIGMRAIHFTGNAQAIADIETVLQRE